MGLYLDPGNDAFRIAVNDDIYVDKTGMIALLNQRINKNKRYVCVSRPRRFGKSMAAEMLAAYYGKGCSSRELFEGLKIEKDESYEKHLNQYHVVAVNVQQFLRKTDSLINLGRCIEKAVLQELSEIYPDWLNAEGLTLAEALTIVYNRRRGEHRGFIFIIDEWDCIFRTDKNDKTSQAAWLDFLRDLFKDRPYVALAYMTGILPIKKYGTHSAINIFDEYSMMNPRELAEYAGFTETEVHSLCIRFDLKQEELRAWYDGYHFSDGCTVYNPKSVVDAALNRELDSYWTETETYEALKIYMDMDFDGLKTAIIAMMSDGRCKINPRKFQNDMTTFKSRDDVLTLLVHLGYLGYDREEQEVYIPNKEIELEFLNATDGPGWSSIVYAMEKSFSLVQATLDMDADTVAREMDDIHADTTSLLVYNDENSLACSVLIAYYSAKAWYLPPIRELPTGRGFADVVYLPRKDSDKPALLIELKWDKSAETAIRQIKERNYVNALKNYTGEVFLVGINYDKKSKHHQCIIERYILPEKRC